MKIQPSLKFYNPKEVYAALVNNKEIKRWLKFISNHYDPPNVKIFLIYPCSYTKPYYESRSYKILFKTLEKLEGKRKEVHVLTISEPFGIVPEEFYGKKTKWHDWKNRWYDCPGLFEWWCKKHSQPYEKEYVEKSIEILSHYIANFFKKVKMQRRHSKIIAFVRTFSSNLQVKNDHTHRRILEKAARIAGVKINLLPTKKVIIKIVRKRGKFAWDMYGVAHPMAQEYLLEYLKKNL
jgi:archaeosine synthase